MAFLIFPGIHLELILTSISIFSLALLILLSTHVPVLLSSSQFDGNCIPHQQNYLLFTSYKSIFKFISEPPPPPPTFVVHSVYTKLSRSSTLFRSDKFHKTFWFSDKMPKNVISFLYSRAYLFKALLRGSEFFGEFSFHTHQRTHRGLCQNVSWFAWPTCLYSELFWRTFGSYVIHFNSLI